MKHELVVGMTGTGKTFYALSRADRHPGPVVYFNPQDQAPEAGGWVRAGGYSRVSAIEEAARAGHRINYVPAVDDRVAAAELWALVQGLMSHVHDRPFLLVVDEADLYAREGAVPGPLHHLAKRGRKQNVWLQAITQFPADLAKAVARNCGRQVFFPCQYAVQYYRGHGLPGEAIEAGLEKAPQFSCMVWEDGKLSGPLREG